MAEFPMKKMKILVIFCLGIVLMESILGFATLYTGIVYREFDKETAEEMLEIIKNTDTNYYEKLTNPEDTEYLKEFEKAHTEFRNKSIIVYGIIIIVFSIGCLIPMSLVLNSMLSVGNEKSKEEKSEKEPGEKKGEESLEED